MSLEAGARPTPVANKALNQGSAYLRGTDAVKSHRRSEDTSRDAASALVHGIDVRHVREAEIQ